MKKKLVWNAFRYDINSKGLEVFNVIREDLIERIIKAKKKGKIQNIKDLKEIIRSEFMYHYWSKCEHEVLITSLLSDFKGSEVFKEDVWFQLEMNLDRIVEYINNELKVIEK